jgi:RNA polymerase sigma-70 factor (ECF subfamily)
MSDREDAADVCKVLAGNVDAYAGIVRRWQGVLVTLAYRFCRDMHRSEEMAQTAFLKAFRALSQWRGEGPFGAWLIALATNAYRSEMRRRRPVMLPLDAARDAVAPPAGSHGGEDVYRDELVRRAVSALPGRYRDPIVLYYFHQMNVREAARSLRLSEGTLKARLHRGRKLLRKKLSHCLG